MGLEQKLPGFITSKLEPAVNWARTHALSQYPFVTSCCGLEYMATNAGRYDIARFGADLPKCAPSQADLLMVVGSVNHKMAPILQSVYAQMAEPKWVVSFGVCASSGGAYNNYATVQGIDTIIPVDVYIPGCPPRPEQVIDALVALQEKIKATPWDAYGQEQRREVAFLEGAAGQNPLQTNS